MNRLARGVLSMAVVLTLTACSTTRPWENQPIKSDSPSASTPIIAPAVDAAGLPTAPAIIAAVTLSGDLADLACPVTALAQHVLCFTAGNG